MYILYQSNTQFTYATIFLPCSFYRNRSLYRTLQKCNALFCHTFFTTSIYWLSVHAHTHTNTHIAAMKQGTNNDRFCCNIMHKKQDQNGMQSVQFPWVLSFTFLGKFPVWLQCPSTSCLVTLLMTDVVTTHPDNPVLFLKKFSDIKNGSCCFKYLVSVFITLGDSILSEPSATTHGIPALQTEISTCCIWHKQSRTIDK
jgi:hypothetical protein